MERTQSNPILQRYKQESKQILEDKAHKDSSLPAEVLSEIKMPKRANYRMRAHCNPLSDTPFPLYNKKSPESGFR
jgi:hypothetical protein